MARITADDIAHTAYVHLVRDVDDSAAVEVDDDGVPMSWHREPSERHPEGRTVTRAWWLTRAISRAMATHRLRADQPDIVAPVAPVIGGDDSTHTADRLPRASRRDAEVSERVGALIRSRALSDAKLGDSAAVAYVRALGMHLDGAPVADAAAHARDNVRNIYRSQWSRDERALRRWASDVYSDARATFEDISAML